MALGCPCRQADVKRGEPEVSLIGYWTGATHVQLWTMLYVLQQSGTAHCSHRGLLAGFSILS